MKNYNINGMRSHANMNKYNNMIKKYATQVNQNDLHEDISEWMETFSSVDTSSSCFILTVVQRPDAQEQQVFPQEYKSMKAACINSTKVLSEIISDCGARCITTDIRNDRFYVTTENNFKITMVME
jgi:hypothetical protein